MKGPMKSSLSASEKLHADHAFLPDELKRAFKSGDITVFRGKMDALQIRFLAVQAVRERGEFGEETPRVFEVDRDLSFKEDTAVAELEAQGAEAELALNFLAEIGMRELGANDPSSLTYLQQLRLKCSAAFRSPRPIVMVDFKGLAMSQEDIDILAEDVRREAKKGDKVVVCFGLDQVPGPWRKVSNVRVLGSGKAGSLLLGSGSHDTSRVVNDNSLGEEFDLEDFDVGARALNNTKLSNEAIPNMGMISNIQVDGDEDTEIRVSKRRPSKRDLTQVTKPGLLSRCLAALFHQGKD